MAIIRTTFHLDDDDRISAKASGYQSSAWLELRTPTPEQFITLFMPLERAQRLADAINAAEAESPARAEAAE